MTIRNVGSLSIIKGKKNGIETSMWDAVPVCDPQCSIFLVCPHNHYPDKELLSEEEPEEYAESCTEKCCLRERYLNSVHTALEKGIKKRDEMTEHKIGLMLIPLYSHLVTFKILEYSLKGHVFTGRGSVNPIYREMRETMRLISSLLKEVGVEKEGVGGGTGYLTGDSDYYDSLIEDGEVVEP